jgi:hypothetical protein
MKYRVAKKVIERFRAGARYRPETVTKANQILIRRLRKYYPRAYNNWYYSWTTTRDLNKMLEDNGLDLRVNVSVVLAAEAAEAA